MNILLCTWKADLRLCTDSAQFDKDPNFSTGYDYKVAKIIANEMLRIYLNKRLVKLGTNNQIEDNLQKCFKYPFRFTGKRHILSNWDIRLCLRAT